MASSRRPSGTRLKHTLKQDTLQKAGLNLSQGHFVTADILHDDWISSLKAASYDPSQPTIFVWEWATLYASEKAISNIIETIKAHAPSGSRIIMDIYATDFITGRYSPQMKSQIELLERMGERFSFGLDFSNQYESTLQEFAHRQNVKLSKVYFLGSSTKHGVHSAVVELII